MLLRQVASGDCCCVLRESQRWYWWEIHQPGVYLIVTSTPTAQPHHSPPTRLHSFPVYLRVSISGSCLPETAPGVGGGRFQRGVGRSRGKSGEEKPWERGGETQRGSKDSQRDGRTHLCRDQDRGDEDLSEMPGGQGGHAHHPHGLHLLGDGLCNLRKPSTQPCQVVV